MRDQDCIRFLQWSLPRLRMRWPGFRKVRGQVCKRIERRMAVLGLSGVNAYQSFLEQHANEWKVLDSLCSITISRFYRDRAVFQLLEHEVIPELARAVASRNESEFRFWSIGCASGEEPYTLALLWDLAGAAQFPVLKSRILATDIDRAMIGRAKNGCYAASSLKELPPQWRAIGFSKQGERFCIRQEDREKVVFLEHDIRTETPEGLFHLILCRNLAFTYFDETLQRDVLERLRDKLVPGGVLVVGIHELLPSGSGGLTPWPGSTKVYRKTMK